MLLNDFYTCQDVIIKEGELNALIIFNPAHNIFKGHFPGQPVVPGVCMMEMVKEQLQLQTGKSLRIQKAGNVKFLQLITPDAQPLLSVQWKAMGDGYNIIASFRAEGAFLFKLDGTYVPL